jgi:peptidoglycan/LPS O-acetylase OafA/YrhL
VQYARLHSLDSARGIAALAVVFHHALLSVPNFYEDSPGLGWLYLSPLRLLVDGTGAVVLFFVLSGLVLTRSALMESYLEFLARRICRIWLPVAAAILAAFGLSNIVPHGQIAGFSPWFNVAWKVPGTLVGLVQHLAMTGRSDLDGPIWTLVHEMRISLILPLLVAAMMWSSRLALLIGCAIAAAALVLAGHAHGLVASALMSAVFAPMFMTGIAVAKHLDQLKAWVGEQSAMMRNILWVTGFICLAEPPTTTNTLATGATPALLLVCTFGGALLLTLCAADDRAQSILNHPIPRYLGRVSYSLYLIHMIMIEAVGRSLGGYLPPVPCAVIAIIVSLALADPFQRFFEVRSTQIGRWLARRFSCSNPVSEIQAT